MSGKKFCATCGAEANEQAAVCLKCGAHLSQGQKSRIAAGLLGVFLGGLGIHRFYLGFVRIGIAQIIVTAITFGAGHIWGFIEGIMILAGTINKDAAGAPLKD